MKHSVIKHPDGITCQATNIHEYSPAVIPALIDSTIAPSRQDTVKAWAILGGLWVILCLNTLAQWVLSDNFGPAPIIEGDQLTDTKLIGLRILEVISVLVVVQCFWLCAIKPWIKDHKFTLEAMLLLGGIFGFVADAALNLHHFLFAFNAHSINLGVWTAFLPFYTSGPTHYAESLLWGLPMYVYFGVSASLAGCSIISWLRRRSPSMTNITAFGIVYGFFIVADFILENTIIRLTDAYMFTKTYGPLTVFAGSVYQFPLYESFCAGGVSLAFTILRQSAIDNPNGLSFVERGALSFPPRWQTPLRTLAVIAACAFFFVVIYHLPFNWLGVIGESVIVPPTYMLPATQ